MKIDGSKRVENINIPVFKGNNKDVPDKNEIKQVEASAADALNSYGRAMITNKPQIDRDAFLKLIDDTIKNYKEKLDCDEGRKEEFICYLQDFLTALKANFEEMETSDINLNNYLLKGYIEDDMKLVNALFDKKDDNGNFRFSGEDIFSILISVTAENKDKLPILLDAKDDNGNFRFDVYDIFTILAKVNSENKVIFDELLDAKDDDGNFRFSGYDISSIFCCVTTGNKDIFEELLDAKDENGNFRFSGYDISSIFRYVKTENKDSLPILVNAKDKNGNFRFSGGNISSIFGYVRTENKDSLPILVNAKDNDGNFRFSGEDIFSILISVTAENKDSLPILVNAKEDDGNFRFSRYYISSILAKVNSENKDIFPILVNAKDDNGKLKFSREDIASILEKVNSENKDSLPILLDAKDEDGNFRFEVGEIYFILLDVNSENKDSLPIFVDAKDDDGKFRFSGNEISYLLKYLKPENKDSLPILVDAKDDEGNFRFSGNEISYLLGNLKPENKDSLPILVDAKDDEGNFRFSGGDISSLFVYVNLGNKDILQKLLDAKDDDGKFRFSGGNISSLLAYVNFRNKDILQKLLDAKDDDGKFRFSGGDISSILSYVNLGNKDSLPILLDAKDNEGNFRFGVKNISSILVYLHLGNKDSLPILVDAKDDEGNFRFSVEDIFSIITNVTSKNKDELRKMLENYNKLELTPQYIVSIFNTKHNVTLKDIRIIEKIIGKDATKNLNAEEIQIANQFKGLLNKQNINEVSQRRKKEIVRNLVASNTGVFNASDELRRYLPLLPKNEEEYCTLLPALVKSLGIETKELSQGEITEIEKELTSLSRTLKSMSDEDFKELEIEQEYTTEEFVKDAFNLVKDLTPQERQKVYDYFGFELYHNQNGTQVDDNPRHSFSITGYPVNLNNGKKLAQIDSAETKALVEQLRPYVIRYSENNRVKSNNKEVENILNEIMRRFPELRNEIGKTQHKTHDYDLMKHSLKVMQKISQNPEYEKLNRSDKKLMMLASLFHDITKPEGLADKTHSKESAFDTYYILKKMKLSKQEEIKLYTLINSHEWLAYVNNEEIKGTQEAEKRMQSVAFDLQYDNLFEMSKILTAADLKAVKADDSYYEKYKEDYNNAEEKISKNIAELKTTQPLMPVTPIPRASKINEAITQVNADGSTNFKGIYKDKNGMIIIKYNEVENDTWEKIGFPKGSISRGIDAKGLSSRHGELKAIEEVNTGNIKFFAHGLDYSNQLSKFDAFSLPDSDALLSVSYAERPESKYRFFRTQGVLLNTPTKYMHGGGETDSGSGCAKNLDIFKKDYIFGGVRESDRKYISNLIKEALNMTDEEYLEFVKENADKPFTSIEPEEVRNTIIKAFSTINSNTRRGNRAYNEMYITNPEVMGVFAYSEDDNVGDVMQFIDNQPEFLKQYALEKDLPFVVFGD